MLEISEERIAELKGKGFLLMRDKEHFNVRFVIPAGCIDAEKVVKMCEIAKKYGIEKIARIPINPELAEKCDNGNIEQVEGDWLESVSDAIY